MQDPPLGVLRQRILHGDDKYWSVGSGEGVIEADVAGQTVTLSLLLKEECGFLLQYGAYDSTDDFVTLGPPDYSVTVEVWIGGDPWIVPVAFFVSREKAWEAVQEFCHFGKMPQCVEWGRLADQRW
jgi:hypothetical protein